MSGTDEALDNRRDEIKSALRELGDVIRATRAPELGWLKGLRSGWPEAPAEILGLKDRHEQAEAGAAPTTRVIWARPSPEAIDRADALLLLVMALPQKQAIIAIGYGVRVSMPVLAGYLHISRRAGWYVLNDACDRLYARMVSPIKMQKKTLRAVGKPDSISFQDAKGMSR